MISTKSIVFFYRVFYRSLFTGKITPGKLKALFCNLLAAFFKQSKVKHGPSAIWVEAANFCNLACKGCWVPALSKKLAPKTMEFAEYKRLIDQVHNTLILLVLQMSGESFLNKHIFDMISYAHQKKIIIWISTNGSFQTPEDWGEKIVNSGLDIMYFSISGTTQEEYKKYHRNGNISHVIDNINKVQTAKKKLHSKKPYISFRMLVSEDGVAAAKKAKKLAKTLNVGLDVRDLTVDYIFDGLDDPLKKKISVSSSKDLSGVKNGCPALWIAPAVQSNGDVIPCCLNFFGVPAFGNINEQDLPDIWAGERFTSFRRSILTNRKNMPGCAHCERNALGFKEPFSKRRMSLNITFHK